MKLKQVEFVKGFEDIEIIYKPKLSGEVAGLAYGAHSRIEISLKANTSQAMLDSTLLHEIYHIFLYQTGWSEVLEAANVSEEGLTLAFENKFKRAITFTYKKDTDTTKVI